MLNKKVSDLLNEQINKELYSAYLYLDMNNYFDKRGLAGFANWYMIQAQEERDHAMLIYKYMQNNDCPIKLNAIAMPDKKYKKDMDVLKAGLEHEEYVTASIHTIYDAAYKVKDFRTMQFLDWFVKEQGEEETNARDLITKMELFGADPKSLYMLNQVKVKLLSPVRLFATPWTAAYQTPPSMGFPRQEYWSGCHCLLCVMSRFF